MTLPGRTYAADSAGKIAAAADRSHPKISGEVERYERAAKVAITSNRPQTTRHTIRGIVHRPDFQIILVDTPGLHRPRTLLGQRLNDLVRDTYTEVDVIGLCI